MVIQRHAYQLIEKQCFRGKALLLIGPRQVGKTTMLKSLAKSLDVTSIWLNADEKDIRDIINGSGTSSELLQLIGEHKLVFIDEAQQIDNIGLKLKLIHDARPDIQVIATGSSSFDLQNELNEPLTGRKREYFLYPISYDELTSHHGRLKENRLLETRLIFGSYPDVINFQGEEQDTLFELVNSYLYKDVLKLEGIRKPPLLEKLLTALALQLGSEVSYNKIAKTLGNVDPVTVEKYLDKLEKAFIIFKINSLSRNFKNEIKKGKKYFFYDCGIRNSIIRNFNSLELRTDKGGLWENYLISERIKRNSYLRKHVNYYFWRTKDQAEIDFIEEYDGILHAYEFKWKNKRQKVPKSFESSYPNSKFEIVDQTNYHEFLKH